MTDVIGPGKLRLVSGWSPSRSLDCAIEALLSGLAEPNDVRRLQDSVFVVFSATEPEEIRSAIAGELLDGESVFVVEFERWSSHGPAADRTWLLRRGH